MVLKQPVASEVDFNFRCFRDVATSLSLSMLMGQSHLQMSREVVQYPLLAALETHQHPLANDQRVLEPSDKKSAH